MGKDANKQDDLAWSKYYVSRTGLPADDVYAVQYVVPFHGGDDGPGGAAYRRKDDLLVNLVDDLAGGHHLGLSLLLLPWTSVPRPPHELPAFQRYCERPSYSLSLALCPPPLPQPKFAHAAQVQLSFLHGLYIHTYKL